MVRVRCEHFCKGCSSKIDGETLDQSILPVAIIILMSRLHQCVEGDPVSALDASSRLAL